MNARDLKQVVVELFVTPTPDDRLWPEYLSRKEGVTVNIKRARAKSWDTWLQFDLSGRRDAVDAFVRHRKNAFTVVSPQMGNVA